MKRQGGFSLIEMVIGGVIGSMVLTLGFMLYKTQSKMQLKQNDASEAQLTVDYVVNMVRTQVVSAGGGLPQMANGIRKHKTGKGITTYVNPEDLSTAVVLNPAVDDTTDGVIQVVDITLFDDVSFVFVTRNEEFTLAEVASVDFLADKITLVDPTVESGLGGGEFVYPVEYCSLFVDTAKYLRKTLVGKGGAYKKIPLATQVDSLDVSYDLSLAGNGSFVTAINDSSKISRVKLFVRVKGAHTLAGATSRKFETIIGVRRGRLYNRAI